MNVVPVETAMNVVPVETGVNVVPVETAMNVVPVETGTQPLAKAWIPAYAGMTITWTQE